MARKKKIDVEYEPSKYQKAIFDFVKNGTGNLVVEACAGSGKTYTLLKSMELIGDDKRILLTAFNKDIVEVLKKKTKEIPNVNVMTMHSLGLLMLQRNFRDKSLSLDEFKYKTFINSNLSSLSEINTFSLSKRRYFQYIDNIYKYIEFGRFYLCQTVKDLSFIEKRYAISTLADEKEIAIEAMNWGKENLDTIDYTDMVWLPNALYCQPIGLKFDWIGLDEAQDLNCAQRELLLKCRKINTRMMSYGDENQCIYAFSGSDPDSFKILKNLPNTVSMPLSISYRCADKIVEYAQRVVPSIEKNNDNREGEIVFNDELESIKDGDMVLCRNNAPLMQIYVKLIKENKKCFIRGKDIGKNLKNVVKNTKQEKLSIDLNEDGVFPRLYANFFETRDDLMIKSNLDIASAMDSSLLSNKLDIINALEVLSDGISTSDELIEKIDKVFSDRKKGGGIALSTIHKAKGLEADSVYIACASLMPSKNATEPWEILQEHNLIYVAYTRAKNKLSFLNEDDFNPFINTKQSVSRLSGIEIRVNLLYGKKNKYITANSEYATEIIKRAKKVEMPRSNNKVLKTVTNRGTNTNISLMNSLKSPKAFKILKRQP